MKVISFTTKRGEKKYVGCLDSDKFYVASPEFDNKTQAVRWIVFWLLGKATRRRLQ